MFYNGEKEPIVTISSNQIKIKAMYGLDIDFSEIKQVSLINKSMEEIGVGVRRNGYGGFGETLKGHFRSKELGKNLLFVKYKSEPTLCIERDGKEDIYISFKNGDRTKELYEKLKYGIEAVK